LSLRKDTAGENSDSPLQRTRLVDGYSAPARTRLQTGPAKDKPRKLTRATQARANIAFANETALSQILKKRFWKDAEMSVITSENKTHAATCIDSEMQRQAAMSTAVTAAQVAAVDIAHYRRIIASCKLNGLPFSNFTQALINLGTGGQ
jgi:hypothetical protein